MSGAFRLKSDQTGAWSNPARMLMDIITCTFPASQHEVV
jgi:hypothetical protein